MGTGQADQQRSPAATPEVVVGWNDGERLRKIIAAETEKWAKVIRFAASRRCDYGALYKNGRLMDRPYCPWRDENTGSTIFVPALIAAFRSICVETRHMRAVLKAQINKTDRDDARGIAQMMRAGLYRPVHVKTLRRAVASLVLRQPGQVAVQIPDSSGKNPGSPLHPGAARSGTFSGAMH